MRTIIILKNILTLLALVLGFNLYQSQLTSPENYIYTKTYFEPSIVSSTTAKGSQSVTYFDGLGRPKQNIAIKATPDQNDLVTPIIYDGYGRQALDYLPIPVTSLDGGIQSTTGSDVNTYYSGIGLGTGAYSEKKFDKSPLDRVLEQFGAGADWKSNNKRVTFDYLANEDNEVLKFVITTSWIDDITKDVLSLAADNFYSKASLYKHKVKDEDDNISYEFRNEQGQTVLVRKMLTTTEFADTYYIYNKFDQLAFVISPKATEKIRVQLQGADLSETGEIIKELSYQYRYDGKQRLAEKKLPGKGWEFMVYDKQDRLVLSQDANLTSGKNSFSGKGWLFTKYDKWGRIVYSGFFSNTATRKAMQTALNNMQANPYNNEERTSNVNFTLQGMPMYYTKNAFPTGSMTLLSVNYYDTYPVGTPVIPATVLGQAVLTEDAQSSNVSTKGLPTATYVKNVDDDNWTKNYILYDQKSRTISTTSFNHLGGYTKVESELDFSGITQKTITSHKRLNADLERVITENFTYDLQNRLMTHIHQVDNNTPETLSQNEYNELSQLEKKKVGGSGIGNNLQIVDYRYNIRGWLTQINDPLNIGTDLFGYKINYNQVDGLPIPNTDYTDLVVSKKYNGNIAEVIWKTNDVNNDPLKTYGYVYDGLNRLRAGFYQAQGNEIAKEYLEKIDYDINGNIARLKRSEGINSGNTALLVDNLKYDYTGNKVNKITDEQYNPSGYPTLSVHNNIDYDDNGNMINLKDKGLNDITYNYLNLTKRQNYGYAVYSYNYRADGVKVSRSSYYTFPKLTYDVMYLDGFQYCNNDVHGLELDIVPTVEGYYSFTENRYIYQYKDHLGNTRVSYVRNSAGVIEVTDKNEYYPFGMSHPVANSGGYLGIGSYKSYKYNGKELQETGMYDYGARMYMPDIGRWGVPDILAETSRKWSPYTYVYDNPLRFIDPTGMYGEDPKKPDPNKVYKGGDIEEVVLTKEATPLKGQMAGISMGMPSNCLICNSYSNFPINIPSQSAPVFDPYKDCGWCYDKGGVMMMGGDMFGFSDLAGLAFSNWYEDLEPDEQKGAILIGGMAIILTHNTKIAGAEAEAVLGVVKTEMTDLQLLTRAAQKAETAIGGTGRFAGTAKHTYANNLLSRYQSIYGNRGLQFNQYFNNNALSGPGNRGFLDVINKQTMTIYDFKFGNAVMSNSQFIKYSNNFPGYSIQVIRP